MGPFGLGKKRAPRAALQPSKPMEASQPMRAGELYAKGMSLYQAGDQEQALVCLLKAGNLGHEDAQCNAGVMYSVGEGTAVNRAEALKRFQSAARQGHEKAQEILGNYFRRSPRRGRS